MLYLTATLLVAALSGAHGTIIGGRSTYINYNSECGVWNDLGVREGLGLEECCPVDATFPGNPWQQLSLSYTHSGGSSAHFSGNSGHNGLHPPGCPSYTVVRETVLHDGVDRVGIEHEMKMGLVTLTKREEWGFKEKTIKITFNVRYDVNTTDRLACEPIRSFTVMHAVDPDQDRQPFGDFTTLNDVTHTTGSSGGLFAEATGPRSCKTIGYGICSNKLVDGASDEVGFSRWNPKADAELFDPQGRRLDYTVHYQHKDTRPLYCGDEREFSFFIVWDRCNPEARKRFLVAHERCCKLCYKSPDPWGLTTPRCSGECPCHDRFSRDCTCTYRCNRGPDKTADDTVVSVSLLEAEVARCDGESAKRLVVAETPVGDAAVEFNINELESTKESCDLARAELVKARRK
eukprot:scpid53585/ scgid32258/ 